MKNTIIVDVDTERDKPILIGKPPEIKPPETKEETGIMITTDISCLCEAMCELIHMSHNNGYAKKEDLVQAAIKHLNDMLIENPKIEE